MSIGAGVHLGDFSRIITGFHSSSGYVSGKIELRDNSVTGSQSLILPGSLVQKNVILGALSVAPMNSTLQEGGVKSDLDQNMVSNLLSTLHSATATNSVTSYSAKFSTFCSLELSYLPKECQEVSNILVAIASLVLGCLWSLSCIGLCDNQMDSYRKKETR